MWKERSLLARVERGTSVSRDVKVRDSTLLLRIAQRSQHNDTVTCTFSLRDGAQAAQRKEKAAEVRNAMKGFWSAGRLSHLAIALIGRYFLLTVWFQ